MSPDEPLGRSLGARLRDEVADIEATPGLGARVRRRHTQQVWTRRALIAAPTAAAIAALTAGIAAGGHPSPTSTDARMHDIAYVRTQTVAALDALSGSILWMRGDGWSTWRDPVTGRVLMNMDMAGQKGTHRSDTLYSGGASPQSLTVDYTRHVWWVEQMPPAPSSAPNSGKGLLNGDPAYVRSELKNGDWRITGTTTVDGRSLLKLLLSTPDNLANRAELWVDARTYTPDRLIDYQAGQAVSTVYYTWLPRDAQNLARFDLRPPPDFRQVPRNPDVVDGGTSSPTR